ATTEIHIMIREVVDACSSMSWSRTGALIVFERKTKMEDIIKAATILDAKPTSELIKNIFFINSPLHDGAMIIRDGRILAAGCVLPLSIDETLAKELGTRHRAGIGITEHTDAVSVIVSEETGIISTAINGQIKRKLSPESLENFLRRELSLEEVEKEKKKGIRKVREK
ncbi:MAG: TIGR00159 family protein, partial [Clostridiales bacterium]|nr:TIGR00159 family protein [Clostridiales bacterium]